MKNLLLVILIINIISCASNKPGNSDIKNLSCPRDMPQLTKKIAISVIQKWGSDLKYYYTLYSRDQFRVDTSPAEFTAYHYTKNAMLMPAFNSQTRIGIQAVHDYFDTFLTREPIVVMTQEDINNSQITLSGCGYGVINGYYAFNSNGKLLKGRYTIQMQYQTNSTLVTVNTNDGYNLSITQPSGWYIVSQHSSLLP
jgi:hypothetical protein